MSSPVAQDARRAVDEIAAVFEAVDPVVLDELCHELLRARRIACYGVGREGLMTRALCMRLMHTGLDAHVVGDMTTPPVGGRDLLLVSAGPGAFATVLALLGVARRAGARTAVVTAQPDGEAARAADLVVHLPAQTMAADPAREASILPMGSLFEAVELLFFDLVSIRLRNMTSQTVEQVRDRHTNLE